MSLSSIVQRAISIAKRNLGDVVLTATYESTFGELYDATQGINQVISSVKSIEYTPDKFTFQELQSGQYQETDVKITVFNSENDLVFQVKEFITIDGKKRPIFRAIPVKVGTYTPVWTLILRS